jgi:hypothetical protein
MAEHTSCGYRGHVCDVWNGSIKFISRYRNANDYCIGGHRVNLTDDSVVTTWDATPAEVEKLRLYLLDEYAAYLLWHCEQWHDSNEVPLQSFRHAVLTLEVR